MFYLLAMLLFAYLLPLSLDSLCFSVLSATGYTVLSDFRPMEDGDQCQVTKKSSVSFCSIYQQLLPLEDLVKPPVCKLLQLKSKRFVALMPNF